VGGGKTKGGWYTNKTGAKEPCFAKQKGGGFKKAKKVEQKKDEAPRSSSRGGRNNNAHQGQHKRSPKRLNSRERDEKTEHQAKSRDTNNT